MVKRTDFTESDDHNLTRFIAQVKPDNSGRLGNKLYIFLEESGDQRPWAKRHSWQSWRERYKKNQDWFNHQIKKYQKKLKESARDTDDREELYAELFGISQFSEEGGDESDVHERSSFSKDNIYPSLENIPHPGAVDKESIISSGRKSTAASATTALQPMPSYVKTQRIVLPRDDDDNFFCTPLPSSLLPAANSTEKGELPILLQGPYRSSLKRSRATFDNGTNNKSWPPKRRKMMVEDIDVSQNVEMSESRRMAAVAKKPVSVALSASGHATRLRPAVQVNAVASSSKEPPSSDTKTAPKFVPPNAASLPKATKDTKPFLVNPKEEHHTHVAGLSPRNSVQSKYMRRPITAPDDSARHLACLSLKDADPFIASNLHDIPPRRIDLRESLNATRRSCHIGSRTSASRSRHSMPSVLLPEDEEIFNQASLEKVVTVIAKHYGFDVDVAMKAFLATKSIEKTKLVLKLGQEAANSATSALLTELVDQAEGDDDTVSSGDEASQSIRQVERVETH